MSTSNTTIQIPLEFTLRSFRSLRNYAIKSTGCVLIELLTNASDAYKRIENYETMEKTINIRFHHVKIDDSNSDNYLIVQDNASGISPEKMKECFLTAGNYTATETSRGFFSTGAKNITAMGDAHFISIKDGFMSHVMLDDGAVGHIMTPSAELDANGLPTVVGVPVTQEMREITGIVENGLAVVLRYTKEEEIKKFTDATTISKILLGSQTICGIRDIMTDPTFNIKMDIRSYRPHLDLSNTGEYTSRTIHTDYNSYNNTDHSDNMGGKFYKRLYYKYPKANLLLSTTFKVPGFEEERYEARFVIYKTEVPLENPPTEKQLEFGFLFKDDYAIYDCNTLMSKYRFNPQMRYLYGYIHCNGFTHELRKTDSPDTSNTAPTMMDPNREHLNYEHPLYKAIMEVCTPRLDIALREVLTETAVKTVNFRDVENLVQVLENFGSNLLTDNEVVFNFVSDPYADTFIAIKSTENHIVKEISGEVNLKFLNTENLTEEQLNQLKSNLDAQTPEEERQYIYYYNEEDELTAVDVTEDPALNGEQTLDPEALEELIDRLGNISSDKPFVFRMNDGDWSQVGIYDRGRIERVDENNDSPLKVKHKTFTIQFINDINVLERYQYSTDNGIVIKINLHNEVVADKLSADRIEMLEEQENFDMRDSGFTSLHFLEEIITSALYEIIVNSDADRGIIEMTDDPIIMLKKVNEYRRKKGSEIEIPIHRLFNTFVKDKTDEMKQNITTVITAARDDILSMATDNTLSIENLELKANLLSDKLQTDFMGILKS